MNRSQVKALDTVADLVSLVRAELHMSRPPFGAMTWRSASSIHSYEAGLRRPPAIFWHDVIDAAPELGLRFNDVANAFGYRPIESIDLFKYQTIHHFFVGVRIMNQCTRAEFAELLGLSTHQTAEIEHRTKPHPDIVRLVASRFLEPTYCYVDVVRRFRTLRPTSTDLDLRRRFRVLRDPTTSAQRRDALRTELISDHIEMARKEALRIVRRLATASRDAADVWPTALVKAVDGHNPQYGDFIPYLHKWTLGAVLKQISSEWQSGTASTLHGKLRAIRQAEDHLLQQLHREPTTAEIASYLELPDAKVIDIRQALSARRAKSLDSLPDSAPIAPQGAPMEPEWSNISEETRDLLDILDPTYRTVVELHFLQCLDASEIAERLDMAQETAEDTLDRSLRQLRNHAEAA